jgi:vancomycin resistance protein VanJ
VRNDENRGRRRGVVVAGSGLVVAGLLVFHRAVPNTAGQLGSLVETFLPWLGLAVPVLAALSWWRRSVVAALATLVTVVAWLGVFGGHLVPPRASPYDLIAVQHNVSDENADPAATVRELLKVRPGLIALEEVTPAALAAYSSAMPAEYAHHTVQGTVGLWSRYPLSEAQLLDIRPRGVGADWNRGLRAVARMPGGDVAVYVAHLPSVRIGPGGLGSGRRNESAALLGRLITAEPHRKVLLLGDLNYTVDDRALAPLSAELDTADSTFAFSWPARLPVARIDQIMGRAVTVTKVWALPATGSDHLPIAATVRL